MLLRAQSDALFAEALNHIPGGVNSPVRAFRAVGGAPFFATSAQGAHVIDADGNRLLDYVGTWGPAILGHAHPGIITAVKAAADRGTSFGIPNPGEVTLARRVKEWVPSVGKIRFCNSGTEACMSAIRLARGFTRRDKIIKFDGCYHGHADSLLVKAGSGALTFGNPDSAGVPADFARHTLVLPFNDPDAVTAAFAAHGKEIAALIVEGVPANAGLYASSDGWDDYAVERRDLLAAMLADGVTDTIFVTGQTHISIVSELRPDPDAGGPLAAFEFVSPSMTADPDVRRSLLGDLPLDVASGVLRLAEDFLLQQNPGMHHLNFEDQGYVLVDVTPQDCVVQYRCIDTYNPNAVAFTGAKFRVAKGSEHLEVLHVDRHVGSTN